MVYADMVTSQFGKGGLDVAPEEHRVYSNVMFKASVSAEPKSMINNCYYKHEASSELIFVSIPPDIRCWMLKAYNVPTILRIQYPPSLPV